jgi:hypothetical protein
MLEVTEAVAAAVGAERVGLRLSPYNSFLSAQDTVERANEKNVWLMKQLDSRVPDLAYVHMVSSALLGPSRSSCSVITLQAAVISLGYATCCFYWQVDDLHCGAAVSHSTPRTVTMMHDSVDSLSLCHLYR